jgi:hypothetical protein
MTDKMYISVDGKKQEAKGEVLEQLLQAQFEAQERERLIEAEQTAKAEAKASAMAKLAALGLNDDEVNAIIGA